MNGRAAPGTTVVIELAGQKAEVVTDAKGSWALAFSPNMPFDAKPEITVTEKLTEMYALRSDNADALVALEKLSPQALEDKLKASPGVTLGGLLRKAYPEVKELVARVDADGVLSGKQTAVNMGITIKPGEEFTHREFNHKKANGTALYGPMYAQLALEDKGPQPWALEEIEANVGAAVGNEGPTANAAQRELYQGAIDKLTKLHARFGSKEALLVSSVPVMVDSPNGQSFPTTVLKVEGPKGPIFVDTAGKEYSSWDDYRSNNTLPPDSVMTLPKNGTVELDAQGLPVIETKNTPSTVDTWQENALYWGQWALMGVGMGTGVGMMATMGLRAYKMISVFRAAQAMGTMARAGQGFAGVSLLGAGYQGHDRYTHGQTFSVLDAEARQMYYGAAFGLTMPAMQTLIKGAKTVAGAYTAGTAMFAGQTSLLASTAEDAALFYENWDSPDLKMSDKAMFFANLGMLGGFMVTGGVKAQFSPSFLRHQAQASMRPTPALTAKMARVVEAMQRRKPVAAPDALTPTETRWLEAKVEGLIGMQETNEHRMLFRNIFDAPINTQQLGNFKALKGKLFDKGPLDATDVSILHSLTAFTPWRQQPMPENLQPGLTTLFTEAGAAAAKRPHQALDRSDRSWLGSKFKEIFKAAKPDSLPAERLTNLRSVEAKLAKNQPLTQAEVLTLVQVTTANGYADLSFVAEAAKPVAEPANKRAAKAKPTGKVAAKSKEKTKTK